MGFDTMTVGQTDLDDKVKLNINKYIDIKNIEFVDKYFK
jgi:hypothetical protein